MIMAKAAVSNPPAETPETPEVSWQDVLASHPNQTVREMWERVTTFAGPLDEIQAQIKAASPPPVSELDAKLATSEDPTVVEFRTAIEKLEKALREAREDAHRYLMEKEYTPISDEKMDELKQKYGKQAELTRTAYGMLNNYADLMGSVDGINVDGVADALKHFKIPNFRSIAHNTGAAQTEGGSRPRTGAIHVRRGNGDERDFDKISLAAGWAKLTTTQVFNAWLKAAGVATWQEVKDTMTFTVDKAEFVITPHSDTEE
jgi:hypothetical protein